LPYQRSGDGEAVSRHSLRRDSPVAGRAVPAARASFRCLLVRETQDALRVVVEDLVHVLVRETALTDVMERLAIRLERHEHGIVAPRDDLIGPERLPGAEERRV